MRMDLTLTRLDERRYETVIRRDDGVRFHVKGVGHMFAIPHDLAHLAIEQALGLRRGFWGSVADGAVFESMTYLGGRRKPHAAERSREVLRANRDSLGEAELLVRIFNDALERGHGPDSSELRARIEGRWTASGHPPRTFTDDEVAAACGAWERMLERWNQLPVGGRLGLEWEMESPRPSRHARRR
ncbi:MAG TPA: hypothetical protein VF092_11930 [Longimicrobium sp.]